MCCGVMLLLLIIYIYSVFFFLNYCPLLIPLYNTAVLINICRCESTLLKYANRCRNWTFQQIARAAQKKGRNGTNVKSDTR